MKTMFVLLLAFLLNGCYQVSPKYCQEVTVTNTEVVRSSESSHYRASFLDTFILTNEDALSALKFNSGDVQAELDAAKTTGEKIWVNYYGWRKPLLSIYPNIKTASRQSSCL
jgi:hypothetical protein